MKKSRHALSRRSLLLGGLAAGAASALPFARRAMADGGPTQRRFVFLYVPGGWDQLLFLDPREFEFAAGDEGAYRAEVERTGIDTGYKFGGGDNDTTELYGTDLHRVAGADSEFFFGPAAVRMTSGTPTNAVNLKSLAEDGVPMAMVRGINMGTLGHEPGYVYFLTGEPAVGSSARGTSMPIRLASQLGAMDPRLGDTLLSTVALSVNSFTGNHPGRYAALRADTVDDLGRILARPDALVEPADVEAALAAYAQRPLGRNARRYDAQGLLSSLVGSSQGVREMLENDLASSFRFLDGMDAESQAIRSRYGIGSVSSASDRRSAPVSAAFVAQTIKKGLAQFVSAAISGGGDSHGAGNKAHALGLQRGVDAIARLVEDLRTTPASGSLGGNWLDHTTICVFSEFGRTPRFNPTGGRDHHFTNSCLLMGAGIRGGRVAGRSSTVGGQAPIPFDFEGQTVLDETAEPAGFMQRHIRPEDIGATLLASAELDYGEYRDAHPLWKLLETTPY